MASVSKGKKSVLSIDVPAPRGQDQRVNRRVIIIANIRGNTPINQVWNPGI